MPQQTLFITGKEYLFKDVFYGVCMVANKTGDGGKVRCRVARKSLKNNIGLATPLNFTAGSNAF
jgi:hypothetical protein